jgi:hypothetical protein
MIEYENPYDPEYQIERRDQSEDGQLRRQIYEQRRSADRLEQEGQSLGPLLLRADAYRLEHPGETIDKCFAEGQNRQPEKT